MVLQSIDSNYLAHFKNIFGITNEVVFGIKKLRTFVVFKKCICFAMGPLLLKLF